MTSDGNMYTLSCPSCGGSMQIKSGLTAITCAWCGSTVVVPKSAAAPRPFAPPDEPLPARVARLVKAGHDGAAVQLLRDDLGLSLQAAGRVVEQVRLSEGRDAARVIQEAQEGKI